MIYLKDTPVGIDLQIQRTQEYLYDKLSSDYDCEITAYGRVYKDNDKGSVKPLYYNGNGNYVELLIDSNIKGLHFFFVEDDEAEIVSRTCKRNSDIDLIVIIDDLTSVRGDVSHYADEEIVVNVMDYVKSFFSGSRVTKGENALSGFDVSKLQFIYPFFVFKITGEIKNY